MKEKKSQIDRYEGLSGRFYGIAKISSKSS